MTKHRVLRDAARVGLAVALTAATASAQWTGPTFPPPGGVTVVNNGQSSVGSSGRVLRFSAFNPTQFSALDWTYVSVANPWASSRGQSGNMAFNNYNAGTGISTWNSTSNLSFYDVFGNFLSFATRLELQFQPYSLGVNSQMGAGWLIPATAGAELIGGLPANQSVLEDDSGANFQVWLRYEDASGNALATTYNSYNHQNYDQLNTSANGGFYYETETAPEPTGLVLLGTGLVGILGFARRKVKSA